MAPIYDTDVAEKRWQDRTWTDFELWEQIELRLRRRKRLWIGFTVITFLFLCSIPVFIERGPKWASFITARRLAQEIEAIQREANQTQNAHRLRIQSGSEVVIERAESCDSTVFTQVRTKILAKPLFGRLWFGPVVILKPDEAASFGLKSVIGQICYDPLKGSEPFVKGLADSGFVLMTAKDLADKRVDRSASVILTGPLAEIHFE